MKAPCDALVVRAAGLRAHLLGPASRQACARLHTLGGLARELAARGYPIEAVAPGAADLETAIRRGAAARLTLLGRWDPEGRAATILQAPEEAQSLRALTRGALEGLPAEARLAGLIPTPALPGPALEELARQATLPEIAGLLSRWRSPWSEACAGAHGTDPDLLELELGLARVLARRLVSAAVGTCRRLEDYARESVDLLNLRCAALLAGRTDEVNPADFFLPGGSLTPADFHTAAGSADPDARSRTLEPKIAYSGLADRLRRYAGRPDLLDRSMTDWRLARWRRLARTEPLTAAPVILYVLALRDEVTALQRMVWSIALGVPPTDGATAPGREAA